MARNKLDPNARPAALGNRESAASNRRGLAEFARKDKVMDEPRTLAIDIGGTGIKAALLDDSGSMIGERQRVATPPKAVAPEALVRAIDEVAAPLGTYDRVSVGFPGYVRDGRVITAPNLGTDALGG